MGEQRVERRLAAIVAADVVGYSRLMGANEIGTLRTLKTLRKELVDPALTAHGGRVVKLTGDGILVEFASVVDAVACAVEVQRAMARRNAGETQLRRIEYRIGISIGDVIVDGADIYGDGVNVAARLQALAEPGGIWVSGATHEQVRDKLPFVFADKGEQVLKNIARPVRIYAAQDRGMASGRPTVPLTDAATEVVWSRAVAMLGFIIDYCGRFLTFVFMLAIPAGWGYAALAAVTWFGSRALRWLLAGDRVDPISGLELSWW